MSDGDQPTCCLLRRKVMVVIAGVLPEEACGVPDTELADVVRFDLGTPTGKPIIGFNYCPWCGKPRLVDGETRITDLHPKETPGG